MKKNILLIGVLCISVLRSEVMAQTISEDKVIPPPHSAFGLYGSLLGDPGINLLGLNLVYEINEDWRLSVGFGSMLSFASSLGASIHYVLPTGSRFKPFLGLGLTTMMISSINDSTTTGSIDFPGFTFFYPNAKLGLLYEAPTGFFVGLHFSTYFFFYSGATQNTVFSPIPALSIGSFF